MIFMAMPAGKADYFMEATLTPGHFKGVKTGASVFAEAPTRHDAILLFEAAKKRLLEVNSWHRLCGNGSAEFALTDPQGNVIHAVPQTGHYIRIRLPGPPNEEGGGYDWVRIEEFEQNKDLLKDQDIFGFRVRPASDPATLNGDPSHFYKSAATSTFLITRQSTRVTGVERGRNEVPNGHAAKLVNSIRNIAVAIGAWMGLSKSQWSRLMKGVIKGPPDAYPLRGKATSALPNRQQLNPHPFSRLL
jgi:hypothetical protein